MINKTIHPYTKAQAAMRQVQRYDALYRIKAKQGTKQAKGYVARKEKRNEYHRLILSDGSGV